jgi:uncharacterized membrane protein
MKEPTTLVIAGMAILAAGTYAARLSGQLLRARITFPPRAAKLLEAAAVIMLAALVATTALTEGHGFSGFARPAGVLVAGVLGRFRALRQARERPDHGIGRVVASADYGTNGGTSLSRPSTIPIIRSTPAPACLHPRPRHPTRCLPSSQAASRRCMRS